MSHVSAEFKWQLFHDVVINDVHGLTVSNYRTWSYQKYLSLFTGKLLVMK